MICIFCDSLFHLNIVPVRSIHVIAYGYGAFHCCIVFHFMNVLNFIICSGWSLGFIPLDTILSKVAMNISLHIVWEAFAINHNF